MTKHFAALSARRCWCFDTVCRHPGSMRRHKQASLQQSIVHLFKPLTQSEMREVRLWQTMVAVEPRGPCSSRGWRCGRLLISLWTSVASIRTAVNHERGEVSAEQRGLAVHGVMKQADKTRQTSSLRVHPVFLRKQTCF